MSGSNGSGDIGGVGDAGRGGSGALRNTGDVGEVGRGGRGGRGTLENSGGGEAGDGGGVSTFLRLRVRRRGFDMTRRSHVVLEDEVDGEGEGGQSVVSFVSELVEPERDRMYGKKRLTGVD